MRPAVRIGRWLVGIFAVAWSLGPVYWTFVVSLTTRSGLERASRVFVPDPLTFDNFQALLTPGGVASSEFYRALLNSLIEAGCATVITVAVALFAGYSFARWKVPGSRVAFAMILGTIAVPLLAVLLPLFRISADWGLMDTYTPIIVLGMTASLAVAVWVMRSFAASIPVDIEQAATMDGASGVKVVRHILVPLMRPAITSVSIIVFLTAWSLFLPPLLFSQTMATRPVTVLIPNYATKFATDFGLQAAAGIMSIVPPVLLVLALHRYLIGGLLAGAGK